MDNLCVLVAGIESREDGVGDGMGTHGEPRLDQLPNFVPRHHRVIELFESCIVLEVLRPDASRRDEKRGVKTALQKRGDGIQPRVAIAVIEGNHDGLRRKGTAALQRVGSGAQRQHRMAPREVLELAPEHRRRDAQLVPGSIVHFVIAQNADTLLPSRQGDGQPYRSHGQLDGKLDGRAETEVHAVPAAEGFRPTAMMWLERF